MQTAPEGGDRRREGTFSFYHRGCGSVDTTASRMNHQYPPHPWGFLAADKAGRTAKHRWVQEALGTKPIHGFGMRWAYTPPVQQTARSWTDDWTLADQGWSQQLLLSTDLIMWHSYHQKTLAHQERWRLSWILGPQYVLCGWLPVNENANFNAWSSSLKGESCLSSVAHQ